MYYVYILQSIKFPKRIYKGFTTDLRRRFKSHNEGRSYHTNKFKPWKVIFYCAFEDELTAKRFEKYLKTASGRAFTKKRLIEQHP